MEENKETNLTVYNEKGEIINCNFERVDFSNPPTLLNYCNDVKDSVTGVLEKTAELSVETNELSIKQDLLNKIQTLDKSLDESEELKNKKQLPVVKNVKNFLSKMGIEKFKEDEESKTYKGRFKEYCQYIEEISTAVESQKQGSINNYNLRQAIIEEMIPYIKQLEEMIKVGYIDKETFDRQIEELKKLEQTIDVQHEIQFKEQLSQTFNNKLTSLNNVLTLYKEQVQSYRMQQATEMEIVMQQESWLSDGEKILKAQGSVKIFNRDQKNKLGELVALNTAANKAIQENAHDLAENATSAIDLSLNGGITLETVQVVESCLRKGAEVFKNGRAQKQALNDKQRVEYEKLSQALDSYNQEWQQVLSESQFADVISKDSHTKSLKPIKRNRLGGK